MGKISINLIPDGKVENTTEPKELFRVIKAGNVTAKKELIMANIKFLLEEVNVYKEKDIELLDLLPAANKAFENILTKFDSIENIDFKEELRKEIKLSIEGI